MSVLKSENSIVEWSKQLAEDVQLAESIPLTLFFTFHNLMDTFF